MPSRMQRLAVWMGAASVALVAVTGCGGAGQDEAAEPFYFNQR